MSGVQLPQIDATKRGASRGPTSNSQRGEHLADGMLGGGGVKRQNSVSSHGAAYKSTFIA